jgi:hypothetical protein
MSVNCAAVSASHSSDSAAAQRSCLSVMLEERVGVQPPDLSLDLFHGLALLRLHPLVVLAAVPVTSNFSSPRDV